MIPARVLDELAARLGGRSVVSLPLEVDPLKVVRAAAGGFPTAVYFREPGGEELAGLGVAWRAEAPTPAQLDAQIGEWRAPMEGMRLLVGFRFSSDGTPDRRWAGFPPAEAVLPLVGISRRAGEASLTVALPPGADVDGLLAKLAGIPPDGGRSRGRVAREVPSRAAWGRTIGAALRTIGEGGLEKVVLARSVEVELDEPADPFQLVDELRRRHRGAYTFGWRRGSATFVGASPELLVARRGEELRSLPLAGSASRGGPLAGAKELAEHRLVVDDIRRRLADCTSWLDVPEPTLVEAGPIVHLGTAITGRLARPETMLALAARLHPTPAVGGVPRGEALDFIARHERIDRGWYAGAVGWTSPGGDGEMAVALRCGLIREATAVLYAGAGIVAASDPDAELAETDLKLRSMLEVLVS